FFSSRRRHTRFSRDWSSDVCSSDLGGGHGGGRPSAVRARQVLLDDPGDQRVGLVQLPAVDGGGEARLAFAARLRQHLAAVIAHEIGRASCRERKLYCVVAEVAEAIK